MISKIINIIEEAKEYGAFYLQPMGLVFLLIFSFTGVNIKY